MQKNRTTNFIKMNKLVQMINIFNLNNSAKVFKNIVEKIKDNESGWVNSKQIQIFEEKKKKN